MLAEHVADRFPSSTSRHDAPGLIVGAVIVYQILYTGRLRSPRGMRDPQGDGLFGWPADRLYRHFARR